MVAGGDVNAVDDGVGGAGVSWPGIGVKAFSVASREPNGVLDFPGVFDDMIGSVGDGR